MDHFDFGLSKYLAPYAAIAPVISIPLIAIGLVLNIIKALGDGPSARFGSASV